jgi:hypothetical protein
MTQKHHIEVITQLLMLTNLRDILNQKLRRQMPVRLPHLTDFTNANIHTHHFHRTTLRELIPNLDQNLHLVATSTYKI